jgi:hypothetical protein
MPAFDHTDPTNSEHVTIVDDGRVVALSINEVKHV